METRRKEPALVESVNEWASITTYVRLLRVYVYELTKNDRCRNIDKRVLQKSRSAASQAKGVYQ
jgi:uncharacterized membrane protein